MIKVARSKSADPAQEALREAKAKWNKNTSDFISDVINLKKMMNGHPSKYSNEKSKIQEPLPEKVPSVLSMLALEFKDLAQVGHEIISKQLEYSKNRRQKRVMNTNNIVAEVQALNLYSYGSNPLSRLMSRMMNVSLSNSDKAKIKKYRMSMLSACADMYRDILNFQEEIVKSTPESIFVSSKLWSKIEKQWVFIEQTITSLAPPEEKKEKETEKDKGAEKTEKKITELDIFAEMLPITTAIIDDVKKYLINFINSDSKRIMNLIKEYENNANNAGKSGDDVVFGKSDLIMKNIIDEYKYILMLANKRNETDAKSFKELASMNKFAENVLNKWVGKLKHKLNPFDKTSGARLDIYNSCKPLLENIDQFMDSLEKDLDFAKLKSLSNSIKESIYSNYKKINRLEKTLEGKGFEGKFVDLLDKGELSEYDMDFDAKQKERLKRMIELKRFRDLSNFYEGKPNK